MPRPTMMIDPADARLTWHGVIEVEHTADGSRGWRLPLSRIDLFPGDILRQAAAMQAGIRISFETDSTRIGGRLLVGDHGAGHSAVVPPPSVDLVIDDGTPRTARLDAVGQFLFDGLPATLKRVEIWLPQAGAVLLQRLSIDEDSRIEPTGSLARPGVIVYGSSITHGYEASSPTQTWPAIAARELGLDLTCLGFSGQCHLDPMIGRLIRDLPADLVVTCLGINVWGSGVFTRRSFLPAVLGLLSTIRDGHPGTPLLVISPICAPDREQTVAASGMTLAEIRAEVHEAVHILRSHGDDLIDVLDGTTVIGHQDAHLLHDGLHPGAEGYRWMASRIVPAMAASLARD